MSNTVSMTEQTGDTCWSSQRDRIFMLNLNVQIFFLHVGYRQNSRLSFFSSSLQGKWEKLLTLDWFFLFLMVTNLTGQWSNTIMSRPRCQETRLVFWLCVVLTLCLPNTARLGRHHLLHSFIWKKEGNCTRPRWFEQRFFQLPGVRCFLRRTSGSVLRLGFSFTKTMYKILVEPFCRSPYLARHSAEGKR